MMLFITNLHITSLFQISYKTLIYHAKIYKHIHHVSLVFEIYTVNLSSYKYFIFTYACLPTFSLKLLKSFFRGKYIKKHLFILSILALVYKFNSSILEKVHKIKFPTIWALKILYFHLYLDGRITKQFENH